MDKKSIGNAVNFFVSKNGLNKREPKDMLELELDGVCEDKFKGKDISRSILIVSQKSYEMAKQNNIKINNGELGENILVNFDPYSLKSGTKLYIGNAIVEISKKSTLCSSLSKVDNKLPKLLKDNRGIFAKVIEAGTINKNDIVELL